MPDAVKRAVDRGFEVYLVNQLGKPLALEHKVQTVDSWQELYAQLGLQYPDGKPWTAARLMIKDYGVELGLYFTDLWSDKRKGRRHTS